MAWIRQTPSAPETHECEPPTHVAVYGLPSSLLSPNAGTIEHRETVVDGAHGDLWRCDTCQQLWRVGDACDSCDRHNLRGDHGTLLHTMAPAWRHATVWQRIRHRKRGRA
jgi:hypothetical protein